MPSSRAAGCQSSGERKIVGLSGGECFLASRPPPPAGMMKNKRAGAKWHEAVRIPARPTTATVSRPPKSERPSVARPYGVRRHNSRRHRADCTTPSTG